MKLWRSWGNRYLWLRLHGPGRVGVESCYVAEEDPAPTSTTPRGRPSNSGTEDD